MTSAGAHAAAPGERQPPPPRRRALRAALFAAAGAIVFGIAPIEVADVDWALYAIIWPLAAAALALTVATPRWRLLAPLAGLAAAMLLRAAVDGSVPTVGVGLGLPLIWAARYCGVRELLIVFVAFAVCVIGGLMAFGNATVPVRDWQVAVDTLVLAAVLVAVTSELARQLARQRASSERHARQLAGLARIAREISASPDARQALCEAAVAVCAARGVALVEPAADGRLTVQASVGVDARELAASITRERSISRQVLETGLRRFVSDAASDQSIVRHAWEAFGTLPSFVFEPVMRDGAPVGVLVIGWSPPLRDLGELDVPAALLAAEAAVAIDRATEAARLRRLARTDTLTQIDNRRAFEDALAQVLADATTLRDHVCVALLDLDHFKRFNDANGHHAGDELLRAAASLWREAVRREDRVARYGGEEFAVVMPSTRLDAARAIIERLRSLMPGEQTCSAGIAEWDGEETADELLRRADRALYAAKRAGRDRAATAAPRR